jgi:hypothetical protein
MPSNAVKSALQGLSRALKGFGAYLVARMREGSTLAGISAAVLANYSLPTPWSYILIALGCAAALLPTTKEASNGR